MKPTPSEFVAWIEPHLPIGPYTAIWHEGVHDSDGGYIHARSSESDDGDIAAEAEGSSPLRAALARHAPRPERATMSERKPYQARFKCIDGRRVHSKDWQYAYDECYHECLSDRMASYLAKAFYLGAKWGRASRRAAKAKGRKR